MTMKEIRAWWAENGLCTCCGGKRDSDDLLTCSKCLAKKKQYRQKRKSEQICARCGKRTDGKALCETCSQIINKRHREDREFLKSIGMCVECGKQKAVPGKTKCADCAYRHGEANRKLRENYTEEKRQEQLEKMREYSRKRGKWASENGLCTRCFKRVPQEGYKKCAICRQKESQRRKQKSIRDGKYSMQEAAEKGICTLCRREKATNGKLCLKCYNTTVGNLRKAKEENRNRYWIQDDRIAFMAK